MATIQLDDELRRFLQQNPGDWSRAATALNRPTLAGMAPEDWNVPPRPSGEQSGLRTYTETIRDWLGGKGPQCPPGQRWSPQWGCYDPTIERQTPTLASMAPREPDEPDREPRPRVPGGRGTETIIDELRPMLSEATTTARVTDERLPSLGDLGQLLGRADVGGLTASDLALLEPYFQQFGREGRGWDDPQAAQSAALAARRSGPFRDFLRSLGLGGAGGGGGGGEEGTAAGGAAAAGGRAPTIGGIPLTDFGEPQFDDPGSALLEDFIKYRLQELFAPVQDPAREALYRRLEGRIGELEQPLDLPPELQSLLTALNRRVGELEQPPFTTGEESALRTASVDRLERDRQNRIRLELEQLGRLGILPTSGVAVARLGEINRAYDASRSEVERDLLLRMIDERQRRLDAAIGMGTQAAAIGEGRQGLQQQRLDQALSLAESLSGVSAGVRGEEQGRRQEALAMTSLLAEMPERRLQLANAILTGQQAGLPPLFQQLLGLLGAGQAQQQLGLQRRQVGLQEQQVNQGYFQGLGTLLGYLATGGRGGGSSYNTGIGTYYPRPA